MQQLRASGNAEASYRTLVEMEETSIRLFETMTVALDEKNSATTRKPLAESRCVTNLRTLGSDKAEFKNWNEKLIND